MSSNPIDVNSRNLLSNLIEVSKPSIIYLLDFVAISALLIAYYDPNYVTNPISFTIVVGLLIAGTLSSAGSAALNCYIDRDIDIKMARTKNRSSATGQLSANVILTYGIVMIGLAAVVSTIFLNLLTTCLLYTSPSPRD